MTDVEERLAALAPTLAGGEARIADLSLLTGGASMETWAFTLMPPSGESRALILRRGNSPLATHPGNKPPLRIEAELIAAAVTHGVPAPEVVHICDAADGLGEAYVMARVSGETLGKRIAADPAFDTIRAKLARQCGAALARIHATPPVEGLAALDVRTTLANYEETWRASGAVRPTIEAAFRWLERRVPETTDLTLVHGDFRNGNLMVDPTTGSCVLGSQCLSAIQGGYATKEVYAEAFVPVLANLPGVKSLNLIVGDRYSRIGNFGNTNNFKFALEYKPIDDLLLRGTMEQVFRAPTLGELYSSGSDAPMIHSDPCTGYTGAPAGSPMALACQYVPTDGSFVNSFVASQTQASTITQGSRVAGFNVKPEQGKTFDVGLVYSPSYVPGLSTTLDVWHLYLNDTITAVGLQSLLNLCAGGSTQYCQYIHRNPNSGLNQGQLLQSTVEPVGNLGSLSTGGIDWSANYKLPQFSFGQFVVGVNATYLKYYTQQTAPGIGGNITYNNAGHLLPYGSAQAAACPDNVGVCTFPRWRAQGFVDWQFGNWSAEWRMRYIGAFRNGSANPDEATSPVQGAPATTILHYGSTIYNDVSLGYNIEPLKTRVDFGVNNLFDRAPPMLYANNTLNANTDPSTFDLMGRYFWARVTVKF